uniref:Uncharacterized protein n=1 Tax=Spermophilus dauricus TaxID=99837 RepID=A0A8C9NXU1_SPEDA
MSEARPVSRSLPSLLRYRPGPLLAAGASCMTPPAGEEVLRPGGRLHLMVQGSNQVALRLACIGDEMDLCFRGLQLAQLPGMVPYLLGPSLSSLGPQVPPARACRELLPVLLLLGLLLSRALPVPEAPVRPVRGGAGPRPLNPSWRWPAPGGSVLWTVVFPDEISFFIFKLKIVLGHC